MNVEHIFALRANAYDRSLTSYAIGIFGMIGAGWLIAAYGINAALPLKITQFAIACSVAAFTALALPAIWSELDGLRRDKHESLETAYEAAVEKQPYAYCGMLSVAASGVFVILTAWVLFLA